jgi:GTP-sensing pleiotropic transcriptional regulator CodY
VSKSEEKDTVTVHVKYKNLEQTFTGNANDVWVSINRFFSETIPAFDLARKITLTIDIKKLVEDFKSIIAIAPEGPQLLVPRQKLTDNDTILLNLLATYIGYKLGKLDRDWLTREELRAKLGKNMKITSTRLGELVREGMVLKTKDGNHKITTIGIKRIREALTRLKPQSSKL